jgi:hypothetical protein
MKEKKMKYASILFLLAKCQGTFYIISNAFLAFMENPSGNSQTDKFIKK